MFEVPFFFANGLTTGTATPSGGNYVEGDLVVTYDDGISQALAAARTPGALDRAIELPFGTLPAGVWVDIITTDAFIHGWDLASATGRSTDIDPDLARLLLERARMLMQPQFRGDDRAAPFGPEQPPPQGASAADELAAFLGRRV
jgi:uncharacterized protein (TIGR03086 family)